MNHTAIESKALRSYAYENGVFEAVFANGKKYRYEGVPQETVDAFEAAESKGSHFLKTINRQHVGVRVEEDGQ